MHRLKIATGLLSVAALTFAAAACSDRSSAPPADATAEASFVPPEPVEETAPVPDEASAATAAAVATASTAPLPPPDPTRSEKGETGARGVLLTWARAIEFGRYDEAYTQWGDGGRRSGMDERAFAAQFAPYSKITIGFGDGDVEGAAGSLYYEVPVSFTGIRKAGGTVEREGTITLRRVNDVPGATPQQLAWHIKQTTLRF